MIFVKVEDYSDIWVQFYHYEVMDVMEVSK